MDCSGVMEIISPKQPQFSVSPKDGIFQATKIADYVCKCNGGEGVLRETVDLILTTKYPNKENWY